MNNNKSLFQTSKLRQTGQDLGGGDLPSPGRRSFLTRGSLVVAGAGMLTLGVGGGLVAPSAWAASAVGDHASETLLRLARDIYPHDTLADKYYTQVLLPLGEKAAKDKALATLLTEGVETLDREARARFKTPYLNVEQETDRVDILRDMEASPFFQKVKGDLMMGIYNNPKLWPWFGYGGSAWEQGGYINRGFDKIDWV